MSILNSAKRMNIEHNVSLRVIDLATKQVVQEHTGHNAATNSLLTGIGHYLTGDGVFNQGYHMLSSYVPQYISLGTMGLISQEEDAEGLPAGIGIATGAEEYRFSSYMLQSPGYGADGYDITLNNNRQYFGLGPTYENRADTSLSVNCELISTSFPRTPISFREVVPETEAEFPETIDVVFGAMISTGALAQFREPGKDYIFITEVGLWSNPVWTASGDNGLLAGYRIAPPNKENWDMAFPENRDILKRQILKVGMNQVVQIVWKIQLGGIDQFGGIEELYPDKYTSDGSPSVRWNSITRPEVAESSPPYIWGPIIETDPLGWGSI